MSLTTWFLSVLAYIKLVEMSSVVTKAAGEPPLCSAAHWPAAHGAGVVVQRGRLKPEWGNLASVSGPTAAGQTQIQSLALPCLVLHSSTK